MSLWRIAWRSIEQRGLASLLTTLSMALGVMMVVAVLSISGVVAESFRNNASLGYNMIVGAKGGKLQLTLNTVYYLSQPVENIPYQFYLEFLPQSQRDPQLTNSIRPAEVLELGRDGKYSQFTALAIPLCLGDYLGPFRVVGTTPDFLERLAFGPESDKHYEFSAGRNFRHHSPEHGFFEAVLGAEVARERKLKPGDTFSSTHGDPEGVGHGQKFTVVGILAPSGTPNDRAAFVNMEGFYLMEDHAKPLEEDDESESATPEGSAAALAAKVAAQHRGALPLEQREVTAILVRTITPAVTRGLQNVINEGRDAQAVLPVLEIFSLFETIVRPIQWLLLGLTALICVVSGVSILVSIYNSMNDRRHEIAVMRALGANRTTVMTIILLESILLSLGGGVLGWLSGHTLNWLATPRIEAQTGVTIGFWNLAPPLRDLELWGLESIIGWMSPEALIIPALIVLAVVVGFLPAVAAYRTDVSKSLQA